MVTCKTNGEKAPVALQQLISLREISTALVVSRKTVRRMLARAGIRAYVLNDGRNGTLRYGRAEVEKFIEAQKESTRSN